jgi:hypothetical protein
MAAFAPNAVIPDEFDLDPGRSFAPFALSAFLAASFRQDTAGPVDEPKPEATGAPIDCGAFSLAHFKSVLMFGIR